MQRRRDQAGRRRKRRNGKRVKSAFASIVGRPSSGKSTLLNSLCGHKISIVSPVPQTTRNKVRGVLTEDRGQIVFVDTPGFHVSTRKFNLRMTDLVRSALDETDLVLYVLDATRAPGDEETTIAGLLRKVSLPIVAAVNKIDISQNRAAVGRTFLEENLKRVVAVVEVSALVGTGIETLKNELFSAAPEGDPMYPSEFYTDQPPEFRVAEIIREKAIMQTRKEVPHAVFVDVSEMEVRKGRNGKVLWIRAFLMVERDSQKGIIVGKGGEKIRDIRIAAQREIEEIFPYPSVYLDLRVKVNPDWRSNDSVLRKIAGS